MATANNCQLILKSMKWCQGKAVKPGIRRRAFAISADQVLATPQYERDEFGVITSATLKGNFELVEGAKWAVIEHLANKATFTSETQGEKPSQTFNVQASLVHPGVGPEAAAATAPLLNSNVYLLVEDMDGRFRWIGSEDYETDVTVSRDNGQGPTGTAGTTINVSSTMEFDAPFYEGIIKTEDGTINDPDSDDTDYERGES